MGGAPTPFCLPCGNKEKRKGRKANKRTAITFSWASDSPLLPEQYLPSLPPPPLRPESSRLVRKPARSLCVHPSPPAHDTHTPASVRSGPTTTSHHSSSSPSPQCNTESKRRTEPKRRLRRTTGFSTAPPRPAPWRRRKQQCTLRPRERPRKAHCAAAETVAVCSSASSPPIPVVCETAPRRPSRTTRRWRFPREWCGWRRSGRERRRRRRRPRV